jgi:hypothetical protein
MVDFGVGVGVEVGPQEHLDIIDENIIPLKNL